MEDYSIKDLMKATHVMRWHTVDTVKQQSLAEHQWSVCMISVNLALLMGLDDDVVDAVSRHALVHDMEEVWTGDLPSPYKEYLKRTGGSPSHGDLGIAMGVPGLSIVGDGDRPASPEIHHNTGIDGIVRAADRIDAWWWSKRYCRDLNTYKDCDNRLNDFMRQTSPELRAAITQLTSELF